MTVILFNCEYSKGCANGDCDGSSCICKPGFGIEPNEKFCIPRCGQGCGNGWKIRHS